MYQLDDLIYLMARLRADDGCAWDRQQDFPSIIRYSIEEVYELADAIAEQDFEHIEEELGDVLFQVVFFAQMGKEQNQFDFESVVNKITAKLVSRHPHVFPNGQLYERHEHQTDTEAIKEQWEAIKAAERKAKNKHRVLDDVPRALPALSRAQKLQKRAANVGFDWDKREDVWAKISEEITELREVEHSDSVTQKTHELGDILFSIINLARHMGIDAESALQQCNHRFEQRFNYIEDHLAEQGQTVADTDLDSLEQLWGQAKQVLADK